MTFTDNHDGTATIAGTPAASTNGTYSYPVCISASNTIGGTPNPVTQAFTLTVDQAPAITSMAAANFTSGSAALMTAGTPGTFTVTTTGNPTPGVTNAAFPAGASDLHLHADDAARRCDLPNPGYHEDTVTAGSSTYTCTPTTLPDDVTFTDNGNGTATIDYTAADDTDGSSYTLCLNATNTLGSATSDVHADDRPTSGHHEREQPHRPGEPGLQLHSDDDGLSSAVAERRRFQRMPDGPALRHDEVSFADNGDGTATISGTPGSGDGGTWQVCITASNGVGTAATQDFTLVITSPSEPLTATNGSSDNVTASLQVNSGSKSFTGFTTARIGRE